MIDIFIFLALLSSEDCWVRDVAQRAVLEVSIQHDSIEAVNEYGKSPSVDLETRRRLARVRAAYWNIPHAAGLDRWPEIQNVPGVDRQQYLTILNGLGVYIDAGIISADDALQIATKTYINYLIKSGWVRSKLVKLVKDASMR